MSGLLKACNGGGDAPIDLTENLVAHYLLNNNADDSHGVYEGTAIGGVDFQGDVASFDGVDDDINTSYSLVDTNTVDKPFTLSIWYKRNGNVSQGTGSTGDRHPIVTSGQDDALVDFNFDFTVNMDTGAVATQVCSGSFENRIICYTAGVQGLSVGYHHYVVSYDGSKSGGGIKLYCDGVELTTIITIQGTYVGMNIEPLLIGSALKNDSVSYRRANGNSSNFRIYSDVKDQAFVTALFEEGYYPKPLPLPTTDGLLAHYPLTGTAEDATGNYDGTEVGNTYVNDAEFGSVASFDGVNDYITIDLGSIPTDYSISFWDKTSVNSQAVTLALGRNINDADTIGITMNYRMSQYYIYNGASLIGNGTYTQVITDIWTHYMFVKSGDNYKMYVNNTEEASTTVNGVAYANALLHLGAGWNSIYYEVEKKDVRFYNRPLTATEKTDIYNYEKNFRPIDIDDGLVAYYPLANNSLDNYYNEYDGVDTSMTYDGLNGVFNGSTSYSFLGTNIADFKTTEYSIACWMKFGTLGFGIAVSNGFATYSAGSSYNSGSRLTLNNGRVLGQFVVVNNETYTDALGTEYTSYQNSVYSETVFSVGEWVHAVMVIKGGTQKMYINGVLENSATTVQSNRHTTYQDNYSIGCTKYDASTLSHFLGSSAHLRHYSKEVSAEQVAIIYNTEKGDFI